MDEPRSWWRDLRSLFDASDLKAHRDFYHLFVASLFLFSDKNAYLPHMLNFIQEMGLTRREVAAYTVGMGVGSFLGPFLLNRLSDERGRKSVVLAALPVDCLGLLLMVASVVWLPAFLVGTALAFFVMEGVGQVQETWSQDLVDAEAQGRFLGVMNVTSSLSKVPGGLLGALVADVVGVWGIFLVAAAFGFCAIPAYRRVPETVED
ncbi:MAG: hypothetical protein Kow0069_15630 [Promethearchaeota archaeon]